MTRGDNSCLMMNSPLLQHQLMIIPRLTSTFTTSSSPVIMRLFIGLFLLHLQLCGGSQEAKFLPVLGKWMRHTRQSGYRPAGPPPAPAGLPAGGVTIQPQSGATGAGYGPGEEAELDTDSPIDLHNKEFCVDVSTYQPVVWEERDGEACRTEWQMQCEDRAEQVCADISETRCDVSSQSQCSLETRD